MNIFHCRTFNLNNEQGLTTLLANNDLKFNKVVQHSKDLNLYFLPSGPIPPNPSEMLGSMAMSKLIEVLKEKYDIIILDENSHLLARSKIMFSFIQIRDITIYLSHIYKKLCPTHNRV